MFSHFKRKKFMYVVNILTLIIFTFTSFSTAYASEIPAAPQMEGSAPAVSDTVNKPKSYGNVIIAPPSDLPSKPGKERIEIPSRRNANSKQFLEPDGTYSVEVYPKSIFYQDHKLQWVPIESQLVSTTEAPFKVKNKANRFGTSFGDHAKVRFQDKDMLLDIQPANAASSQGVVSGNKVKYRNVYSNTDIEYTSDNDMIKEDIILSTPDAPHTFTFDVTTRGLKIEKDAKTGLLFVKDKKDKPVAYFMAPFMVDANNKVSSLVTLDYQNANGKEQLVVAANADWLNDPARQYPIKIDPTLIKYDVHKDTFVSDWYPSTQFSSYDFLSSGYDSGSYGKTRSYIQYVLPNLPSSSQITSASFSLYQ